MYICLCSQRLRGTLACVLAWALCLSPSGAGLALAAQQVLESGNSVPVFQSPVSLGAQTTLPRRLDLGSGFSLSPSLGNASLASAFRSQGAAGQAPMALAVNQAVASFTGVAVAQETPPLSGQALQAQIVGRSADPDWGLGQQTHSSRPRSVMGSLAALAENVRSASRVGVPDALREFNLAFDRKGASAETDAVVGRTEGRARPFLDKVAAVVKAAARLEVPVSGFSSGVPSWLKPAVFLVALLITVAAVLAPHSSIHAIWFVPLLGMMHDLGPGDRSDPEHDDRGNWQKRFRASISQDVRPGYSFTQAPVQSLIQEGAQKGYIILLKEAGERMRYLYAVPAWIYSLSPTINHVFGNLLARGIRSQQEGKLGAALADFLDARRLLDQEIEQSVFHKKAVDQEAYALDKRLAGLLANNALVALFRAEVQRLREEFQIVFQPEVELSVAVALDSFVASADAWGLVSREMATQAEPALQNVAKTLVVHMPSELNSPNKSKDFAAAIEEFMQRVYERAHPPPPEAPVVRSVDQVPGLTSLDPATSQKAYFRLLRPMELPLETLLALVPLLKHRDLLVRTRAADVLGNQTFLPPEVRKALERIFLKAWDKDAVMRAGNLLVMDDLMHRRPIAIPRRNTGVRVGSGLDGMIAAASIDVPERDIWRGPVTISPEEVIQRARSQFYDMRIRNKDDRETFERFLDRALSYAATPLRLMKVILAALKNGDWRGAAMSGLYAEDIFHKLWVEKRLLDTIPPFLVSVDSGWKQKTGHPGPVVGILVVGSFASHPTYGSDLNYLWVIREDEPEGVPTPLGDLLGQALGAGERFPKLTLHGTVRHGTLNYGRQINLGAIYLGPEGRYPETEVADIGLGH